MKPPNTSFIETDYLIIGAGAMGIAFADEIFTTKPHVKLTVIDKRSHFGGHWNDAYDFVKLHQPAAFYGVNSLVLGNGKRDLSSKPEILAYYKKIEDKFKASGRVHFLSKYHYMGNNKASSIEKPTRHISFRVNKKVVDARYMNVEVPFTHSPKYTVDEGVSLVPINGIAEQYNKWKTFFIIGNGKTGIDAILFLLSKKVKPENITWIISNDGWLFNRDQIQVGKMTKEILTHGKYIAKSKKPSDVFLVMEKKGGILRLDKDILPTKWKCATINSEELMQLQSIKNKIRKGRITHITRERIYFQEKSITYPENTLFVNCSSDGLAKRKKTPIFSNQLITLQSIFFCQQVFSAAAIAKLELTGLTDRKLNNIKPVPHPEVKEDWAFTFLETLQNLLIFNRFAPIWLFKSRLNFMSYESPFLYLIYAIKAAFMFFPLKKVIKKWKVKNSFK